MVDTVFTVSLIHECDYRVAPALFLENVICMGLLPDYIRQYHLTCSWGWFIKLVVCTTECPCSVCLLSGSPSGHYKCYHLLDALCGMSVSNFFTFFFFKTGRMTCSYLLLCSSGVCKGGTYFYHGFIFS